MLESAILEEEVIKLNKIVGMVMGVMVFHHGFMISHEEGQEK